MSKKALLALAAAFIMAVPAYSIDWPFHLSFQLGFSIRVIPSQQDQSRQLGVVVAVNTVRSDKTQILAIGGTITNNSENVINDVAMNFSVTSYIGTQTSNGIAIVKPNTILPGCTADFEAYITLLNPKPYLARYTITGQPTPCVPNSIP